MTSRRHVLLVGTNKPAVVPALLARPHLDVTVVTEPWYAQRYRDAGLPDVRVVDAVGDLTALSGVAAELAREGRLDVVLGPSERSVQPAAFLRSSFGLPGTPYDVAVGFTAKHVMKQRLAAAGVPVAPFGVVRSSAELPGVLARLGGRSGVDLVVKPSLGTGGSGSTVVRGEVPDLPWLAGTMPAAVVERRLDVEAEYHLDALVVGGENLLTNVCRYHAPVLTRQPEEFQGAVEVPDGTALRGELLELHDRVVAVLGLRAGMTHLEVLQTSDGLHVGEVAARPGGGGIMPFLAGVHDADPWGWWVDVETGVVPQLHARPHRSGRSAWFLLPLAAGRVTAVTPAEELLAIDGVRAVHLDVAVGDVVPARFHSSSGAGSLLVVERAGRPVEDVLDDVRDRWRFEVEDEVARLDRCVS